jgi:membrane-associated phospholipid phosphatase
MKKLLLLTVLLLAASYPFAQVEPNAGKWKTWFIGSGKDVRLPVPPGLAATKQEIKTILSVQQQNDSGQLGRILYWNTGSPSYRWREVLHDINLSDTSGHFTFVMMLLTTAIYDGMVATWDTKYTYRRLRPFEQDRRIKALIVQTSSPSYPCEYSVAAGVASTLIAHFFPQKADTAYQFAKEVMQARVAAGVQYPSDTKTGFELGKTVALQAIEKTKKYLPVDKWDGKIPNEQGLWNGKKPIFPMWGKRKPMVLNSADQFRPGPPPDYTKEMEELKNFKPTFRSTLNAFQWASGNIWRELLDKKVFEYNLHLNPPRAERIYALRSIVFYDANVACWDAKYTYWGIRPDQYDTTYRPTLMGTPNFPGYPSMHAVLAGAFAVLFSDFFPAEKKFFWDKAKEATESRVEGGVHFRSDNTVGFEMGKKIGELVLQRAKSDGADERLIAK